MSDEQMMDDDQELSETFLRILEDDDADAVKGDDVTAVRPVGTWVQDDPIMPERVRPVPVEPVDDSEAVVFGLDLPKERDRRTEEQRELRSVPRIGRVPLIAVAAAVMLALVGVGALAWARMHRAEDEEAPVTATVSRNDEATDSKEEQSQPTMTASDIKSLVSGRLTYGGSGVVPSVGTMEVQVSGGNVMVTHRLPDGNILPGPLVEMAGKRANATAARLTGQKVSATSGEEGSDFESLTWVVCNDAGEAYLATTELPGQERPSDSTYGVLAGSTGYAMCDSLYEAIGGASSGIDQRGGIVPRDLGGVEIDLKAVVGQGSSTGEAQTVAQTTSESEEDTDSQSTQQGGGGNAGNTGNTGGGAAAQPTTPQSTVQPTEGTQPSQDGGQGASEAGGEEPSGGDDGGSGGEPTGEQTGGDGSGESGDSSGSGE